MKTFWFSFLQQTCFFFLLLQLGVQAEGIKELFSNTGKDTDFNALFKKVSVHRSWKRWNTVNVLCCFFCCFFIVRF